MKKLFLLFATVTLLVGFQACKEKPAEETDTTEVVAEPDMTPAAVVDSDTSRIPVPPVDPIKK